MIDRVCAPQKRDAEIGPSATDEAWVERRAQLKFGLGGISLFAKSFPAVVYTGAFSSLSTDPDEPCPPLERSGSAIRAVLVRSHPIGNKLPRLRVRQNYIRYAAAQYRRFHIDLDGSFDEYMKRFSSQRRNHLKRLVKHFTTFSGGQIKWREYKFSEEMREFHQQAREISRKTYQENLADAGMPDGGAFVDELCRLAAQDRVRGYVLFDQGKPIAYQYCPIVEDTLICDRIGYDPDYRQHAPGNILFLLIIEHAFLVRRCRRFDLGRGEFPYKETLSSGHLFCADIYYFRPTFSNALLVVSHSTLNSLWRVCAFLLDRVRLRTRLKKLIRLRYGSRL